ncbi:hypothetical protein D3C72_2313880 [compost metagenome]
MRIGADRFEIGVHREQDVGGACEGLSQPLLQRLDAPALPEMPMAPARAEIGKLEVRQFL